jgi:hypothetical protein
MNISYEDYFKIEKNNIIVKVLKNINRLDIITCTYNFRNINLDNTKNKHNLSYSKLFQFNFIPKIDNVSLIDIYNINISCEFYFKIVENNVIYIILKDIDYYNMISHTHISRNINTKTINILKSKLLEFNFIPKIYNSLFDIDFKFINIDDFSVITYCHIFKTYNKETKNFIYTFKKNNDVPLLGFKFTFKELLPDINSILKNKQCMIKNYFLYSYTYENILSNLKLFDNEITITD